MKKHPVVLLTATVEPQQGQSGLTIWDPTLRLSQYLDTLAHVLSLDVRVVLAENSGADLLPFYAMARSVGRANSFEGLSLETDWQPKMGRGYAETLLVGASIDASRSIAANELVWKITGRYKVSNLMSLMKQPSSYDLYFNLRKYPHRWADMWVYALTRRGWQLLAPHTEELRSDLKHGPAERSMFQLIEQLHSEGHRVQCRLPREPRIQGARAFDGRSHESARQRTKYLTRVIARSIAPAFWV